MITRQHIVIQNEHTPGRLDIVEKAKVSNECIEINRPDWIYL